MTEAARTLGHAGGFLRQKWPTTLCTRALGAPPSVGKGAGRAWSLWRRSGTIATTVPSGERDAGDRRILCTFRYVRRWLRVSVFLRVIGVEGLILTVNSSTTHRTCAKCCQCVLVDGTGNFFFGVHRFVVCPLGCGAEVRQERLGGHMDDECPLRRLPCEACGLLLPLETHAKHLAESCVRVPRRCTNGMHVGGGVLGNILED